MNLRAIYETYRKEIDANRFKSKKREKQNKVENQQTASKIADTQMLKIQSHYPVDYPSAPASISIKDGDEETEGTVQESQALQPVEMKSIESNLNEVTLDENRIVQPNAGLSGLFEFVPATKLKGN